MRFVGVRSDAAFEPPRNANVGRPIVQVFSSLPTILAELPLDGRTQRMLVVSSSGLPEHRPLFPFEIIGVFDPDGPPPYSGPDGFRQNGVFLHFLQWVIGVDGPGLAAAREAAHALGSGQLQVIDGRAGALASSVPEEDILGSFEVRDGSITAGSFKSNVAHRPFTERGLFKLDSEFVPRVLERMAAQVKIEERRQ